MQNTILQLSPGDRLELKKPHPCGARVFRVLRAASDVRIVCEGCGRDMMLERIKLEKAVKRKLLSSEEQENGGN